MRFLNGGNGVVDVLFVRVIWCYNRIKIIVGLDNLGYLWFGL